MSKEAVSTDLIIKLPSVMTATTFTDDAEFEKLYSQVKEAVDKHVPDLTTRTGRESIASMAYKVSRTKTALIAQGKKLTEDWRDQTKKVNAACNAIEERLDTLRDEVRKPLTDWEASEKARVEGHERAVNSLLVYVTMSADHPSGDFKDMRDAVEALIVDASWEEFQDRGALAKTDALAALDRLTAIAEKREADAAELERLRAAQVERDRQDAERRVAEEAAEAEAQRVEQERQAEEKRKADIAAAAAEAAAQAERDAAKRIADAERAAQDAKERAERDIAAAKAEADRKAEAERKRIVDALEAEAAEQRRRDADRSHRKAINQAIVAELIECSGITAEQAQKIVVHMVGGLVPNVTLKY
jgi:hypothetical protein